MHISKILFDLHGIADCLDAKGKTAAANAVTSIMIRLCKNMEDHFETGSHYLAIHPDSPAYIDRQKFLEERKHNNDPAHRSNVVKKAKKLGVWGEEMTTWTTSEIQEYMNEFVGNDFMNYIGV
jgi:hypothetical protein